MLIYYLKNETIEGPYSVEELKKKRLTSDTMIWYKNSPEWKRLDQVPEVYGQFGQNGNGFPETETITAQLASFAQRFRWLFIWIGFNMLALILSYAQVKPFNYVGEPSTEKFWPFIKFTDATYTKISSNPDVWGTLVKFNGLFANYDWSEFSVYVGGTLFILLLYYMHKRSV